MDLLCIEILEWLHYDDTDTNAHIVGTKLASLLPAATLFSPWTRAKWAWQMALPLSLAPEGKMAAPHVVYPF